ncbi:PEP-CTERM sorting domain-containing protein [Pseudoduganella lutea]|nr:PEP-CTERM sorting domain-containing protein [Pseudoduganella lutea]
MLKTVAIAMLLAVSCGANAAPTYNFSYTGFLDQNTGNFSDSYQLKGSFSGNDANHDGFLDKTEISSFFLNGTDYIGCAAGSNAYYQCGTDNFLYKIGGALDFSAGIGSSDPEGFVSRGHYFVSGSGEFDYVMTPFSSSESAYLWTSDTTFSIGKRGLYNAQSNFQVHMLAVPEPGTWAMLATGLLVVVGTARRRKGALQVRG